MPQVYFYLLLLIPSKQLQLRSDSNLKMETGLEQNHSISNLWNRRVVFLLHKCTISVNTNMCSHIIIIYSKNIIEIILQSFHPVDMRVFVVYFMQKNSLNNHRRRSRNNMVLNYSNIAVHMKCNCQLSYPLLFLYSSACLSAL